jgi:hypothetical protein
MRQRDARRHHPLGVNRTGSKPAIVDYLVAGLVCFIPIITIPFGIAADLMPAAGPGSALCSPGRP